MKLTCERCRKSFAIEEPVAGRVYRIPCRCGHMIVMHFPAASPPPLRARATPPPRNRRTHPRPRALAAPRPVESPAAAEGHADASFGPSVRALVRAWGDAAGGGACLAAAEPEPIFTRDLVLPSDAESIVPASRGLPDLPGELRDDPFAAALSTLAGPAGSAEAGKPSLFGDAFVAEAAARLDAIDASSGDGAAPALAKLDPTASPDDREEPCVSGEPFPTGWRAALALRVAIARDRARLLLRAHGRVLGAAAAAAVVFYGLGVWTAAPRGGAEARAAPVDPATPSASALPVDAGRVATEAAALPRERAVRSRHRGEGRTRAVSARAAGAAREGATLAAGREASASPRGEAAPRPRAAASASSSEPATEDVDAPATDRAPEGARPVDATGRQAAVPEAEAEARAEARPGLADRVSASAPPAPAEASAATAPGASEPRSADPSAAPAPASGATPAASEVAAPPAESPAGAERAEQPEPTIAAPAAVSARSAVVSAAH